VTTARIVSLAANWYDASGAFISQGAFSQSLGNDGTSYAVGYANVGLSPALAAFACLCVKWSIGAAAEIHYVDDVVFYESGSSTNVAYPPALTTHYTAVSDLSDSTSTFSDLSYVISQTDNQIDTWAHTDPSPAIPSGQAVKGVVAYTMARTDTPSAKSLAMVCRSSSTDAASSDTALPQTYGEVHGVFERPPSAAPAYRTSASTTGLVSGPYTASVTIPAGVVAGDLMLLFVSQANSVAATTPTGWTHVRSDTGAGTNPCTTRIFQRVATAADTGGAVVVSTDFASTARYAISLVAYSGTSALGVITGVGVSTVDGTTATAPTITSPVDNCRIIECLAFSAAASGTETVTGPATVRLNPAGASNYVGNSVSDQSQATAGATGTQTATATSGSWVAHTLAVAGVDWTITTLAAAEFGVKVRP
jgi:hypothetical protein